MQKTMKLNGDFALSDVKMKGSVWATSRENVSLVIFDQVRFKPVSSATEAN